MILILRKFEWTLSYGQHLQKQNKLLVSILATQTVSPFLEIISGTRARPYSKGGKQSFFQMSFPAYLDVEENLNVLQTNVSKIDLVKLSNVFKGLSGILQKTQAYQEIATLLNKLKFLLDLWKGENLNHNILFRTQTTIPSNTSEIKSNSFNSDLTSTLYFFPVKELVNFI